jgi:hypothetical protein
MMAQIKCVCVGYVADTLKVYATPTGLKAGSKGRVSPPSDFYTYCTKSEARRIRKRCRALGLTRHAAASRS